MTGAPRARTNRIVVALVAAATGGIVIMTPGLPGLSGIGGLPGASGEALAQVKTEKAAADQRARELFLKADAAYAEGRYEEALGAFQEAYDLSGRPQLLFNISNSLERLGRYQEAVDALEKYLSSGKAKDRDVVQKRLTNLKKRVEEQKKEQEKLAKEEEEKRQREEAERKRKQAAQGDGVGRPREQPLEPAPTRSAPVVPWLLLAGGTAVFATGVVFGVMTLGARSEADERCKGTPAGRLCDAEARSALDREQTFGLIADIGMVSGVLLAGIGTYLLVTDKPDEPYMKVGVRAHPGGGGIQVGGAF